MLGVESNNVKQMMKKIDLQLNLAITKNKGDASRVNLTDMNKYVGY